MTITIRQFEERDYGAVLDVYNSAAPLGIHPPEHNPRDSKAFVAIDVELDEVIGFAVVPMKPWYSFDLVVMPRWQRQGIGRLLWECIAQDLIAAGGTAVEPWVREENAAGIAWLEKLGFAPTKLDGPVNLFLSNVDTSHFESAVTRVACHGFDITTLAREREQDHECLHKLHSLYNRVSADAPNAEGYRTQCLEEFTYKLDETEAMPDAYFIAKHGSEYVGLSYIRPRNPDPNLAEPLIVQQCLTGVLPEYRRRGIATALKIKTINYSRASGYRRLFTGSENPAMQALNAKLGFVSGPWRVYRKALNSNSNTC